MYTHLPLQTSQSASASAPRFSTAVSFRRTPAGCSCPWCLFEGVWMETSDAPVSCAAWVSPASRCLPAAGPSSFCFSADCVLLAAPASSAHLGAAWICRGRRGKRNPVASFSFRDTTNKKWPPRPGGIQQRWTWRTELRRADIYCCPVGLWSGRQWWLHWWTRTRVRGRGGWPGWSSPPQRWLCAPLLCGCPPSEYIWAPKWRDRVRTAPLRRTGPCQSARPAGAAAATAPSSLRYSWRCRSCTTRNPSTDPASAISGSWCWSTRWCSPSSWASGWPRQHRGRPGVPGRTPGSE